MSAQPLNPTSSSEEDVLEQLCDYEVTVLMDDSWSMTSIDSALQTRWEQAVDVMEGVVKVAMKYDTNGIEIRFLNSGKGRVVKSELEVKSLFEQVQPSSSTPLGKRLGEICRKHLQQLKRREWKLIGSRFKSPKRCLIIAITDGVPDSKKDVYSEIEYTTSELNKMHAPRAQLGIQFVQIGNDTEATNFLKKLDDDFGKRDIVDTVPYNGMDLTPDQMVKILIGAVNRMVDKQAADDKAADDKA